MPLINQVFEYLPDIDTPISSEEHSAITSSLLSSLPASASTTPHPSLPPAYTPKFSALISSEHERLATGSPRKGGIDTSRYSSLDPPSSNDAAEWRSVLKQAYAAHTHLSIRNANLDLLEEFGRNTWLLHNDALEKELALLEGELARTVEEGKLVESQRGYKRAEASGEFEVLEDSWRRGVGRALETEIAAEGLRRDLLERRRAGG